MVGTLGFVVGHLDKVGCIGEVPVAPIVPLASASINNALGFGAFGPGFLRVGWLDLMISWN
jgi:hypothetical protein